MKSRTLFGGITIVFVFSGLSANAEEPVDLSVIHRIKAEALENSKVMEHVFYLTDVNGDAGSPIPLNRLHCGLFAHP